MDTAALWSAGKRLILLDVDNTLLPWRSHDVPDSTHRWIDGAKSLGFKFCVLSNTRNPARLKRLCEAMGVEYVRSRFKPSRAMFRLALEKFSLTPEEAVMIGDQLLTDVLGANRAGIDAIWVRPIGGKEFFGTRYFSRNVERVIGTFLYRHFQADSQSVAHSPVEPGHFEHSLVGQFGKFVVVGGSSTVIDLGLHFFLMYGLKPGGREFGTTLGEWLIRELPALFSWPMQRASDAAFPVLKVISASVAICNSFVWNRLWTFRIRGRAERGRQFRRFLVVALIGLALNTLVASLLYRSIPAHPRLSWLIANAVATVVVAAWNFAGQKLWAFRVPDRQDDDARERDAQDDEQTQDDDRDDQGQARLDP